MRELDFGEYGLYPIRPAPYTWRSIIFDDNDLLVPLEQSILILQVRRFKQLSDLGSDAEKTTAAWTLGHIKALL